MPRLGTVSIGQWVNQTSSIFKATPVVHSFKPFSSLSSSATGSNRLVPRGAVSPLNGSTPMTTQVRGRAQVYYRPSAWKRVNKHGIEKRLMSQGGIEVLWRRILKKRHSLTPFDRILPGTVGGKVLPDHHFKFNKHLVDREIRMQVKQAIRKK